MNPSDTLKQLLLQSPYFLALLAGSILSLIFMRRSPKPAILAAGACAILLLSSIAVFVIQGVLVNSLISGTISNSTYSVLSMILSFIPSCIRAVAIGMFILAVFLGRSVQALDSRFPVIPSPPDRGPSA